MPINKFLYFGDFGVIPIAVLAFAALAFVGGGLGALAIFSLALVFGGFLWTLVEYLVHRYAYHHAPVLSPLHDLHHREPDALIGVPSFVSTGLIIVVCYLPLALYAPVVAGGFTSGMLIGYAAYMFVHHATHHWKIQPGDWLYRARVRHMGHHSRDDINFGVSTGFWDRVFGTARMPRERVAPTQTSP